MNMHGAALLDLARPMGILFIISVAALLALLWAAFATARHVRRARKRQRNAMQAVKAINGGGAGAVARPDATDLRQPDDSPETHSESTRDWAQLRYTPSSFTADRALNRKV